MQIGDRFFREPGGPRWAQAATLGCLRLHLRTFLVFGYRISRNTYNGYRLLKEQRRVSINWLHNWLFSTFDHRHPWACYATLSMSIAASGRLQQSCYQYTYSLLASQLSITLVPSDLSL